LKKTDPRNTIAVFSEGHMNPLTYYEQIIKMKGKADKFDLRLRIIKHALTYGVKPTARDFDTTPKTVRKWLNRYKQEHLTGLNELPRIPHNCPHKTSSQMERKVVSLRKQFPFKGSKRLKREHNLSCSHEAIRRILKEHDLVIKRRKKHKRKRDLREIKKKWPLFSQITADTKDLKDIPHYWPQMKTLALPKYQFTAREIRSGLMFLGFANEKSASNACLFARILCEHLRNCGVDMKQLKIQTDNGTEFIGCFRQDRSRDGFEKIVEGFGAKHKRIPPRAWSYNSDVETVHRTIEDEFYDLENFEGIKDFHQRVASYQAWYNLLRQNSNKDYKAPLQIIRELGPNIDPAIAKLPPLMLDWLGPDYITKEELSLRGYVLPCYP
jgi:transposase